MATAGPSSASVKKKFQCTPYSLTCSAYCSFFTLARRMVPRARRGRDGRSEARIRLVVLGVEVVVGLFSMVLDP